MKVLHLFSNSKWTGPAEPALNLCAALRGQGVEADFACSPGPDLSRNRIVSRSRELGIEPILQLALSKHRRTLSDWKDRRRLRSLLRESGYSLVHVHLDNAHRIAARPCQEVGVPLLRSSYDGEGLRGPGLKAALARTTAIVQPSQKALDHDTRTHGFERARMQVVDGAIDLERFDPARPLPDARQRLDIASSAFVIGIVARMQRHRRYADLFGAFKRLTESVPDAHLVVIGRGTFQEQVAFTPVKQMGLGDRVHFTGYLSDDDFVAVLSALDAGVYLIPGSDGTCRAVRELLAMGVPMAVADRGMLSEIVVHEKTGLVFDGSEEGLFQALRRLASEAAAQGSMGGAARADALRRFSIERQAEAIARLYESVVSGFSGVPRAN